MLSSLRIYTPQWSYPALKSRFLRVNIHRRKLEKLLYNPVDGLGRSAPKRYPSRVMPRAKEISLARYATRTRTWFVFLLDANARQVSAKKLFSRDWLTDLLRTISLICKKCWKKVIFQFLTVATSLALTSFWRTFVKSPSSVKMFTVTSFVLT